MSFSLKNLSRRVLGMEGGGGHDLVIVIGHIRVVFLEQCFNLPESLGFHDSVISVFCVICHFYSAGFFSGFNFFFFCKQKWDIFLF